MTEMLDWNVAVYCVNEATRLQGCLDSILDALAGRRALVTVILNGSQDGSLDIARAAVRAGKPVEVVQIAAADKANAMNQFYHVLRSPARAYAGVDGYAFVIPGSFQALERRMAADPHALVLACIGVTGRTVPLTTKETVEVGGQLHGQFHALRPSFLDRMVARGIRLPIGLYRGDGLIGSMAAHNLDPIAHPWDNTRLPGIADAKFAIQSLSILKPNDVRRQFRRKVRQMRGIIENAAIKSIIYKAGYEGLPLDCNDMIRDYLATHGVPKVPPMDRIFMQLAVRQAASAPKFTPQDLVGHKSSDPEY